MQPYPFLELRELEPPTTDGRTITARICTYGRVYDIGRGQRERVRAGAFKGPLARPTGLVRWRHMGNRPGDMDHPSNIHGHVRVLREQDGGLFAEMDLMQNADGERLAELVRAGAISGVSMGAHVTDAAMVNDQKGTLREIRRVGYLAEVSLTDIPAYDDAEVLALREKQAAEVDQARLAALAELAEFRRRWL